MGKGSSVPFFSGYSGAELLVLHVVMEWPCTSRRNVGGGQHGCLRIGVSCPSGRHGMDSFGVRLGELRAGRQRLPLATESGCFSCWFCL